MMAKLTRSEKIKVGVGTVLIVLVIAFAAAPVFSSKSPWDSMASLLHMVPTKDTVELDEPLVQSDTYAAADVRRLDIDWTDGDIRFTAGTGDDITVTETIDAGTYRADLKQAEISLQGDTLRIDDALDTDTVTWFGDGTEDGRAKHLVIELPDSNRWRFDAVDIATSDAQITGDALTCRDLTLSAMDPVVAIDHLDASGVSLDMMDGDVALAGAISTSVEASYMDGSISLALGNVPLPAMSFSGMDGSIALDVSDNAGFTLSVASMSGNGIEGALADKLKSSGDGSYVYGDGSAPISIDSMDGSISIS